MELECNFSLFPKESGIENGNRIIEVTKHEVLHAAYTVGKQSYEDVNNHPYYSEREKDFRITMVQAFLNFNADNIKRSPIFEKLDPSEKGAINFFLGMVFCKVIMMKEFGVVWLMHLDMFDGLINEEENYKGIRPDFIAKQDDSTWIAVEAKSRQIKNDAVVEKALNQLEHLATIDGEAPSAKIATVLHGEVAENLRLDVIDPKKGKNLHLQIDNIKYDYVRDYYATIVLLINKEMNKEEIEGRKFAVRYIACHEVRLGLDYYIYDKLTSEEFNVYITKEIEKHLIEQNPSENKEYYLGLDGVYVQYVGYHK